MASGQTVVQLKITLLDVDPPVWRRVRVAGDITLRRLHDIIQAVMGWQDSHLHEFEIGEQRYGQAEGPGAGDAGDFVESDTAAKLDAVVEAGVEAFVYTYDFGDDWLHEIEVEEVVEPEAGVAYPVLVDGKRRCPPEDCGGPPGYAAFLEAMDDEAHPDHADLRDWYGGPFDPDDMDLETVEAALDRIRPKRRAGGTKVGRRA